MNWATIGIAIGLITAYLSLWWMDGNPNYLQLGLVFLVWLGIYITGYWQPILYLIMASIIIMILVFWAFDGLWDRLLGQITIILNVAFLLLVVYLFYYEEMVVSPTESKQ